MNEKGPRSRGNESHFIKQSAQCYLVNPKMVG